MVFQNFTERCSLLQKLFVICTIICAVMPTSTPFYGNPKNFYVGLNQASLTTSDVQNFDVTLPTDFTISTISYRKPFFAITQVQNIRIQSNKKLNLWARIRTFTPTKFTFQLQTMIQYIADLSDSIDKFLQRQAQWGFQINSIVKYRYLVIRDTFPTNYISYSLEIVVLRTLVNAQNWYQKTVSLNQLVPSPNPFPLVLNDYDTVFIHSFTDGNVEDGDQLNSFGIQFSFVVQSTNSFMLKLVTKYKLWMSNFNVNVFIYNRKDFQNLKVKVFSSVMTFDSLLAQSGFALISYYTPSLSPAADSILYGLSGFDFSGYDRLGWEISITTIVSTNHYRLTLTNLISTSAIPKIQIMITVIGQFQCPNGELLINEALDTCFSNAQGCPAGTINSNVEVGKTEILICKPCAAICQTCLTLVSQCMSCYASQNRKLNGNSCVPMPHFYDDGTLIAKACHGTCDSCSGSSSTSCDSCYPSQNRELIAKSCKPLSGYYEDGNDVAPKCDSNCLECITTATTCTSCVAGKFLSSQKCLPCVWPCITCSDATLCKTCVAGLTKTGYSCNCPVGQFADYSGSQCSSCSAAMTACQECDSSTHCTKCSVGYYLNSGSTCTKCKPGCLHCNDLVCLQCRADLTLTSGSCYCNSSSYFQVPSQNCLLCSNAIKQCTTCTSSTVCTKCSAGYYLNSGSTCTKCKPGCLHCNDSVCLQCYEYLTLTQGSCNCNSGFYFDSDSITCKSCSKAIANCQTCNSSTTCTNCFNGSHLAPYGKSCHLDSQITSAFLASSPGQIQTCKSQATLIIVTFCVGIVIIIIIIVTLIVCCLKAKTFAPQRRESQVSQDRGIENDYVSQSMKEIKTSAITNALQNVAQV